MLGRVRWPALFVVAVIAAFVSPASVSAHSDYERSVPARDEVVQAAPALIDVFFTQEVFRQEGSNFVRVFDSSGTQVSDGDGVIDDDDRTHISATLQPDLPPGRYIVRWKTLSDIDGDDDEGAFCFYIAVQPSPSEQEECAAFAEEGETPGAPTTEPAGPTATAPEEQPTSTPAATPASTEEDDDDGGTSAALIAGIIAGVVVVIVVGGGAIIWLRRTLQ